MECSLEQVICPIYDGHQRGGKRLRDLSVTLPRGDVQDFVWTWYSECLIQDHVLQLFREHQITGFDVRPVRARFNREDAGSPPKLWELVRTGWAGLARPESGIRVVEFCEARRHVVYSGLAAPQELIDPARWDGSDLFMVWPMPLFVFATTRVMDLIRERKLTGVRVIPVTEMEPTDGYSPGRLSYWMPEPRAGQLGAEAGIAEI